MASSAAGTTASLPIVVIQFCPTEEELSTVVQTQVPCPIQGCSRVLPNNSSLTMHLKMTHHVIQPGNPWNIIPKIPGKIVKAQFHCPVQSCRYAKSRHDDFLRDYRCLKTHYMRCHAEKTFHCDKCCSAFAVERLLRWHKKVCRATQNALANSTSSTTSSATNSTTSATTSSATNSTTSATTSTLSSTSSSTSSTPSATTSATTSATPSSATNSTTHSTTSSTTNSTTSSEHTVCQHSASSASQESLQNDQLMKEREIQESSNIFSYREVRKKPDRETLDYSSINTSQQQTNTSHQTIFHSVQNDQLMEEQNSTSVSSNRESIEKTDNVTDYEYIQDNSQQPTNTSHPSESIEQTDNVTLVCENIQKQFRKETNISHPNVLYSLPNYIMEPLDYKKNQDNSQQQSNTSHPPVLYINQNDQQIPDPDETISSSNRESIEQTNREALDYEYIQDNSQQPTNTSHPQVLYIKQNDQIIQDQVQTSHTESIDQTDMEMLVYQETNTSHSPVLYSAPPETRADTEPFILQDSQQQINTSQPSVLYSAPPPEIRTDTEQGLQQDSQQQYANLPNMSNLGDGEVVGVVSEEYVLDCATEEYILQDYQIQYVSLPNTSTMDIGKLGVDVVVSDPSELHSASPEIRADTEQFIQQDSQIQCVLPNTSNMDIVGEGASIVVGEESELHSVSPEIRADTKQYILQQDSQIEYGNLPNISNTGDEVVGNVVSKVSELYSASPEIRANTEHYSHQDSQIQYVLSNTSKKELADEGVGVVVGEESVLHSALSEIRADTNQDSQMQYVTLPNTINTELADEGVGVVVSHSSELHSAPSEIRAQTNTSHSQVLYSSPPEIRAKTEQYILQQDSQKQYVLPNIINMDIEDDCAVVVTDQIESSLIKTTNNDAYVVVLKDMAATSVNGIAAATVLNDCPMEVPSTVANACSMGGTDTVSNDCSVEDTGTVPNDIDDTIDLTEHSSIRRIDHENESYLKETKSDDDACYVVYEVLPDGVVDGTGTVSNEIDDKIEILPDHSNNSDCNENETVNSMIQYRNKTDNSIIQKREEADNSMIQNRNETDNSIIQNRNETDNSMIQTINETDNSVIQNRTAGDTNSASTNNPVEATERMLNIPMETCDRTKNSQMEASKRKMEDSDRIEISLEELSTDCVVEITSENNIVGSHGVPVTYNKQDSLNSDAQTEGMEAITKHLNKLDDHIYCRPVNSSDITKKNMILPKPNVFIIPTDPITQRPLPHQMIMIADSRNWHEPKKSRYQPIAPEPKPEKPSKFNTQSPQKDKSRRARKRNRCAQTVDTQTDGLTARPPPKVRKRHASVAATQTGVKFNGMSTETQTTGDYILEKAMRSAAIPTRKRKQQSSQASQVSPPVPTCKPRKTTPNDYQTHETQTMSGDIESYLNLNPPQHHHHHLGTGVNHQRSVNVNVNDFAMNTDLPTMKSQGLQIEMPEWFHAETQTFGADRRTDNNQDSISTQTRESFLLRDVDFDRQTHQPKPFRQYANSGTSPKSSYISNNSNNPPPRVPSSYTGYYRSIRNRQRAAIDAPPSSASRNETQHVSRNEMQHVNISVKSPPQKATNKRNTKSKSAASCTVSVPPNENDMYTNMQFSGSGTQNNTNEQTLLTINTQDIDMGYSSVAHLNTFRSTELQQNIQTNSLLNSRVSNISTSTSTSTQSSYSMAENQTNSIPNSRVSAMSTSTSTSTQSNNSMGESNNPNLCVIGVSMQMNTAGVQTSEADPGDICALQTQAIAMDTNNRNRMLGVGGAAGSNTPSTPASAMLSTFSSMTSPLSLTHPLTHDEMFSVTDMCTNTDYDLLGTEEDPLSNTRFTNTGYSDMQTTTDFDFPTFLDSNTQTTDFDLPEFLDSNTQTTDFDLPEFLDSNTQTVETAMLEEGWGAAQQLQSQQTQTVAELNQMQTQTSTHDLLDFDTFLSHMETQTSADDFLAGLGLVENETQTQTFQTFPAAGGSSSSATGSTQYDHMNTVETQTQPAANSATGVNDLNVSRDSIQTQTLFDSLGWQDLVESGNFLENFE